MKLAGEFSNNPADTHTHISTHKQDQKDSLPNLVGGSNDNSFYTATCELLRRQTLLSRSKFNLKRHRHIGPLTNRKRTVRYHTRALTTVTLIVSNKGLQEAQLSQRGRAALHVVDSFPK